MSEPESPLAGLRVVEIASEATLFAGRLFADLGAYVTRVEPPGGDPCRTLPPLVPGPGGPLSAPWAVYGAGRDRRVLDLESEAGRGELAALLVGADVLLHPCAEARAQELGLDPGVLGASYPGLVAVAITPFGFDGPLAEWEGSDLVAFAMSGYLHMTGPAESRPIRPSAPLQMYLHAGNHAFAAALLALRQRRLSGRGAFIDQAVRDTGTWMLTHTYQHWDMARVNLKRQGAGRDMGSRKRLKAVFPSADGFVVWMFTTGHLGSRANRALVAWMDECGMAFAWLKELDWDTTDLLGSAEDMTERLEAAFGAFYASKTGDELLDWAIAHGLMLAPVNAVADVARDAQLAARDSWRTLSVEGLGNARVPGPPIRIEGIRWETRSAPPATHAPPPRPVASAAAGLPLAGVRVLDFGSTLAAPVVARHLSDFGADVVKVESESHPDTLRVGTPYAGGVGGLDRSGYFAAYNAGKRSFALDLRKEGALEVVRRLVEGADVLVENFAPGVMRRLGLGREVLHGWNPRLVIASHSLQGQTGPRSGHRGYGQIASAMTGWYDLTGEEGGEPLGPYSAYTDFLSWPFLLSGILLALEERERTGEGQYIDHAQVESSLHFLAPLMLEHQLTGRTNTRRGNHEDGAAPNNAYRCAGDDRWIAITVRDDERWRRLAAALGAPGLAGDARFAILAARKANEAALDATIDALTATWDAFELAVRLQAAGIAAGPVLRASDLFEDAQLAHRGAFRRLEHPELGDHAVLMHSFRVRGWEPGPFVGAPLLGQHTYDVARELGLGDDDVAAGVASGLFS